MLIVYINIYLHVKVTCKIETRLIILAFIECCYHSQCNTLVLLSSLYCTQEADCQLKHVEGYNDIIKEVCKFYIQGHCYKGESCPYMHNILWLNSSNLYIFLSVISYCAAVYYLTFPLLSCTVLSLQVLPQNRKMFSRSRLQVFP